MAPSPPPSLEVSDCAVNNAKALSRERLLQANSSFGNFLVTEGGGVGYLAVGLKLVQ
jgi:hypothetical protein